MCFHTNRFDSAGPDSSRFARDEEPVSVEPESVQVDPLKTDPIKAAMGLTVVTEILDTIPGASAAIATAVQIEVEKDPTLVEDPIRFLATFEDAIKASAYRHDFGTALFLYSILGSTDSGEDDFLGLDEG